MMSKQSQDSKKIIMISKQSQDSKKVDDLIKKHYKIAIEKLSPTDKKILTQYKQDYFSLMNKMLRTHSDPMVYFRDFIEEASVQYERIKHKDDIKTVLVEALLKQQNKLILICNQFDRIFLKMPPFPEEKTLLFRGVTNIQEIDQLTNKVVGDQIRFEGYLSTSTSVQVALGFASCGMDPNNALFIFHVHTKHNIRLLPINQEWLIKTDINIHDKEHEVLLPRSTEWKLLKISKIPPHKYKTWFDESCIQMIKAFNTPTQHTLTVFELESSDNVIPEKLPAITRYNDYNVISLIS